GWGEVGNRGNGGLQLVLFQWMIGTLQQDIGRLEVAVNHAAGMSGMNGPRQRLDQLCRRTHRLGCAVKMPGEAASGDELENEVRPARGLADVENLDNVGM